MEPTIYDHKRCDILIARYGEQAENLRHADRIDQSTFVAFMALQLLIACWISVYPPLGIVSKAADLIIDLALVGVCVQFSAFNHRRRADVRTTIQNINEAFGLYAADIYLPNRAINPPPLPAPFIFYGLGYWAAFACVAVAIFLGGR